MAELWLREAGCQKIFFTSSYNDDGIQDILDYLALDKEPEDEYFVNVVRNEWEDFQIKIPAFKEKMSTVSENISVEQVMNFERWRIMDWYVSVGLISLGTWEKEVEYVEQFFADRITWLDAYLKEL